MSKNERDEDEYDKTSAHFAVFTDHGEVVGYSRLHLAKGFFMIEREFNDLVGPHHVIRKENDTVEASRFAISRRLRRTSQGFKLSELLCRVMCQWSRLNNVRYWYLVLGKNYLDFIHLYFKVEPVGEAVKYEPDLASVAIIVDLIKIDAKDANEFWDLVGTTSKSDQRVSPFTFFRFFLSKRRFRFN